MSRAAVRRVGEGEGKGGRPLAQCRTMPLVCRITVRKGGVHKANPASARALSPRLLVYGRAPPADGRTAVRKGGVHKANPAPTRAFSPRQLVYGRAPARLCAESLCAKAECTRQSPPLPVCSPRGSLSTAVHFAR